MNCLESLALMETELVKLGHRNNTRVIFVRRIIHIIKDLVYNQDGQPVKNLAFQLSTGLEYDYTYVSNFFSETTNMTIEKYYICQRIERVKQLLNEGLTLTEIAHKMHYPSPALLAGQFEKVTGQAYSQFGQGLH